MRSLAGHDLIEPGTARRLTAIIAGSLIVFVAIFVWMLVRHPFDYYYDDGLFYLQIGRSLAFGRGIEFARGIPTNGFHPFWMLLCAAIARIADGDPWRMIDVTGMVTAALDATWVAVCWFGLKRHFTTWTVGLGLLAAIPYAMFRGVGMESPLAILMLAAFVVAALDLLQSGSARSLLLAGVFGGLAVFARLDLAFIVLPPALHLASLETSRSRTVRQGAVRMLPALSVAILPAAAWLLFNRITFGAAIPISGMLKIASAASHRELFKINDLAVILLVSTIILTGLAALRWRDRRQQFAVAIGLGQILFVLYLVAAGHRESYPWYFVPLSASLAVLVPAGAVGLATHVQRLPEAVLAHLSLILFASGVAGVLASSALLVACSSRVAVDRGWYELPTSIGPVARARGIKTVLAYDRPGLLAFLDGLNVIAADGLTTNYGLQKDLRVHGIEWLIRRYHVQAIIAPRVADPIWPSSICNQLYLNSTRYVCRTTPGGRRLDAIRFYSRLDGNFVGEVPVGGLERLNFEPTRGMDVLVLPRSGH